MSDCGHLDTLAEITTCINDILTGDHRLPSVGHLIYPKINDKMSLKKILEKNIYLCGENFFGNEELFDRAARLPGLCLRRPPPIVWSLDILCARLWSVIAKLDKLFSRLLDFVQHC